MIRLLVALDGSRLAEEALDHAMSLARSFESELHLLKVIEREGDPDKPFDGFDWELRRAHSETYLRSLKNRLSEQRIDVFCHVAEGHPPTEIIRFCESYEVDLILLCAYGVGGVTQFPTGSTVQKVIAKAGKSLMVVRSKAPSGTPIPCVPYRRILVLLDGSYRSDWALFLAARVAQANRAELCLLQVVQEPQITPRVFANPQGRQLVEQLNEMSTLDAQRHIQDLKVQLPRSLEVSSRVVLAPEIPPVVEEVVQAEDIDLLVLGTRGMSDYWLYGLASETILAHTSRPVLVFQDNLERNITLKAISGEPACSQEVDTQRHAQAG